MRKPRVPAPWEHTDWEEEDAFAFQALERGVASDGQQKRALAWILEATHLTEPSFVPLGKGGDPNGRVDAFIEGKRSIGRQIRNLLRLNIKAFREGQSAE